MYHIDFNNPVHVHFIGIGGISMSGLAELLLSENFKISGSDNKESALTRQLSDAGCNIFIGQKADNIDSSVDACVYTAAIHPDNAEWKAASDAGIPMLTRAQFLGQLMDNYAKSIAVSGTHGKTTTTSMISHILLAADSDPTISVGGMLEAIGGNIRVGGSDVFLTEACEYTNSFLNFHPKYSIILNIEEDHMDFFKDINDIRNSFHKFAQNTAADGILFLNAAIDHPEEITADLKERIVTFGLTEDADYTATDITYNEEACASFTFNVRGQAAGHVSLNVPGKHNIANALAAIAFATEAGFDTDIIIRGLQSFGGTARRFEYKGKLGSITIIDDYAHHPTEIAATLTAARNYPHDRIICVFQPHTYTRTKAFWNQFSDSLALADVVVLADVYAARETDTLGIHCEDLADDIRHKGTESYYFPSFDAIENFLLEECHDNDLVITMGAGDIYQVGEHLLGKR